MSNTGNGSRAGLLSNGAGGGGGGGGGTTLLLDPSKPSLSVCVLSAYDLPVREPPLYVSITVGNNNNANNTTTTTTTTTPPPTALKIGPPLQRHKDRNSFKFPRDMVQLHASSLPELYQNKAIVKVVYPDASQTLYAEYPLHQLKLHETVWIILQLQPLVVDERRQSMDDDNDPQPDEMAVPPTLRLQWTLHGPYRAEIGFIVNLFSQWFTIVDEVEAQIVQPLVQSLPNIQFLWIPAAPLLAGVVVTAPILAGVVIVTLPVAVPILVALFGILGTLMALASCIYASTKTGRTHIANLLAPAVQTILSTRAGQSALYQTGPRPTPVSMCRVILPNGFLSKLFLSLLIDAIGSSSYLIPLVGEITDLGWAPIQTILLMALYETNDGSNDLEWLKYVSFLEEILPFTDICPTATLGWFIQCGIPHWFGKDVAATVTNVLSTTVQVPHSKGS